MAVQGSPVIHPLCALSRFSSVQLFAILWAVACQAPLSMGFSRQDTGVGYHALLQGIYLTQGLNPRLMSPAVAGGFFTTSTIWEAQLQIPHFIDTNHLLYRKEASFLPFLHSDLLFSLEKSTLAQLLGILPS